MPRTCTICRHTDREAIDASLVGGESFRHIAARFGVSTTALQRHKRDHLPAALAQAQDAVELARGDDLLAQVRGLQRRTLAILTAAERARDGKLALQAVGEARRNLELMGKLAGELQQEGTVNIIIAPQWVTLRTVILAALGPYPEARLAVARALEGTDGDAGR
jgi:transposase